MFHLALRRRAVLLPGAEVEMDGCLGGHWKEHEGMNSVSHRPGLCI